MLAVGGADTPYYVYTHGMLDPWFKRQYPIKHLKKWAYWPWSVYWVLRRAKAVLFTTEEERILARQSFWLYRCNEAVVGYGAGRPPADVAAQKAAFAAAFPETEGARNLLFLGRIDPKKGCDLLIEAFAAAFAGSPEWRLVMAGPDHGGWRPELEAAATRLGVADRITWTGSLQGDLKWGAFRAADAFVLPSHQENFGVAVVEALACGTPVLISDKVNIWREIVRDQAGLAASDDLAGTISLLERWAALSPDEAGRMRAKAPTCFDENFETQFSAKRLIGLIQAGAARKPTA